MVLKAQLGPDVAQTDICASGIRCIQFSNFCHHLTPKVTGTMRVGTLPVLA
jgi:hypothetical protein